MSKDHIDLLNEALSSFSIPPCLYVDEEIAAAINYGYYSDVTSQQEYRRNILFVNCDSDQMTVFLVHYEQHKMQMINFWHSSEIGGRRAMKVYKELVLDIAVKENELNEDQVKEINGKTFQKLKLMNDLRKSYDMLSAIDCDMTYVNLTDILPDIDITVEVSTNQFDEKVSPEFKKVKELFGEVRKVGNVKNECLVPS